jgi:hypothetical protein
MARAVLNAVTSIVCQHYSRLFEVGRANQNVIPFLP